MPSKFNFTFTNWLYMMWRILSSCPVFNKIEMDSVEIPWKTAEQTSLFQCYIGPDSSWIKNGSLSHFQSIIQVHDSPKSKSLGKWNHNPEPMHLKLNYLLSLLFYFQEKWHSGICCQRNYVRVLPLPLINQTKNLKFSWQILLLDLFLLPTWGWRWWYC